MGVESHWLLLRVREPEEMAWDIELNESLPRRELHQRYGGGWQSGITPSKTSPNVFIFSNPEERGRYGYNFDGWSSDNAYLYTLLGPGDHRLDLGLGRRGPWVLGHRDRDPDERVGRRQLLGDGPRVEGPQRLDPAQHAGGLVRVGEVADESQRLDAGDRRQVRIALSPLQELLDGIAVDAQRG